MHRYLRAVGFSNVETKYQEIHLLKSMEKAPPYGGAERSRHEQSYAELKCEVGEGFGVILHGYRDENGIFCREFYFPYMEGQVITTMAGGYVRRHGSQESYAVLCEEYRLGSALIFFLTNGLKYRERMDEKRITEIQSFSLTGLSVKGTILLPVKKTERQIEKINANTRVHNQMLEAAREGDESAMESLTMEDINLYSQISRRMLKEDVYSIVDSCFMPTGVECDHYMVIGEIGKCRRVENLWTREKIWQMQINCNSLDMTICINEKDLLGEPKEGRRFKGDIWLQGIGSFVDESGVCRL